MKRILIALPIILLIGFTVFYFWGSSGSVDLGQLNSKIVYHDNYKKSFDTVEVITYNLGYLSGMTNNLPVDRGDELFKENLLSARSMFEQMDADIIGFQEIDFGSARSICMNQLDSIAVKLGFPVAYQSINWDKTYLPFPYWPPSQHFGKILSGQAVLSKFELQPIETITLEKPINAGFFYKSFYLDRLIQIVKLNLGRSDLIVMNLHLEAFDQETRVAHGHVVKELYERYAADYPVLLIGDFNSESEYVNSEDALSIIMTSANIESAIIKDQYFNESTKTFPSEQPDRMIDYILFNNTRVQKVESRVVKEAGQISDHLPVMMKFIIH